MDVLQQFQCDTYVKLCNSIVLQRKEMLEKEKFLKINMQDYDDNKLTRYQFLIISFHQ